jgi:hypothetical protein
MTQEVVSHENNFAPQIVEYVEANEALADPVTRRDYFEQITEDDFIDMTQRVASMVRTGDKRNNCFARHGRQHKHCCMTVD